MTDDAVVPRRIDPKRIIARDSIYGAHPSIVLPDGEICPCEHPPHIHTVTLHKAEPSREPNDL